MNPRRGAGNGRGWWDGKPSATSGFALLTLLLAGPARGGAQDLRWRPDDRVFLTSFHLATALLRDERNLFMASGGGLLVFDHVSERWDLPSTAEDGFPAAEEPGGLALDPGGRTLWMGTLQGNLFSYHVDLQRWELEGSPGVGPLLRLAPPREAGGDYLYALTTSGWYRIDGFSLIAEPVPQAPTGERPGQRGLSASERLARLDPAFAAAGATVTTDAAGRTWPLSDFAPGDREGVYWLATAGDGLYRYDGRFGSVKRFPFGPLGRGAAALAYDGEGVWIGGDGRGPRRGSSWSTPDLAEWRYFEAGGAGVPGVPGTEVLDILWTVEAVWFATRDGVRRHVGGRWVRPTGPASDRPVRRLARTLDGTVWAATAQGLLSIAGGSTGGEFAPRSDLAPGASVDAVSAAGDTVWAAGAFGVRRFVTGVGELPWPEGPGRPPQGPVADLAWSRGTLWAATDAGLWAFDGARWVGPDRSVVQGGVGRIERIRALDGALWVTGVGGAARRSPTGGGWTYLEVGPDIPAGPVLDVVEAESFAFLATPYGVLRVDLGRLR